VRRSVARSFSSLMPSARGRPGGPPPLPSRSGARWAPCRRTGGECQRRGQQLGEQHQARDQPDAERFRGQQSIPVRIISSTGCGGRLRLIAPVEDPAVVGKILAHLGLLHPGDSPGPAPPPAPSPLTPPPTGNPSPPRVGLCRWRTRLDCPAVAGAGSSLMSGPAGGIKAAVRVAISEPATPPPGFAGPGPV
jgi:hypothetical protein